MAARTHLPLLRTVLLAGLGALLAGGCSQGSSEFNGNRDDPDAVLEQTVRTPSPVGTDLPFTDPPLGQTLPGPTGGVPGVVPTTAPPASPGGDGEGDSATSADS